MNVTGTIYGISDVCAGPYSPSVPYRLRQCADALGLRPVLLEPVLPDSPPAPPTEGECAGIEIRRVPTPSSFYDTHGRASFIAQCARAIDEAQPAALIVYSPFVAEVLLRMTHRPPLVIYWMLEMVTAYYDVYQAQHNATMREQVDVVVVPDARRGEIDLAAIGWDVPTLLVPNAVLPAPEDVVPPDERLPRLLYAGTISSDTGMDWYHSRWLRDLPIDFCGMLRDARWPGRVPPAHRYLGLLERPALNALRPSYRGVIVLWVPRTVNQFHAAPNKLYEALAQGVPFVSLPHPQCKALVNEYGCGIIATGWTARHLGQACARMLALTPATYRTLVAGAVKAGTDLTGENTFAPVAAWLEERQCP